MKKRMLAGLMAACILWTTLPASAFQEDGPAEPAASAVADGDTRYGYKNVLGEDATSTQNAGRMWVDHTVSTANSLTFDDGGESEPITREEGEDFLVTYSALSSTSEVSILPDTTPSDTIFVLDFSMTMNWGMDGEILEDYKFSETRTKAMLDAMDETITTLKASNPDNRVGIVTFCGLSDVLLPLTRVGGITEIDNATANNSINAGNYGDKKVIYPTKHNYFSASAFQNNSGTYRRSWVRCNIEGGEVNMLSDWTSMQAGLYEALKMFRDNWEKTAQSLENRRANVIVITDGDSNTLAKQIQDTPWYENMTTDKGGHNQATGGNLAFATLLTAAYLKYEAEQRYESCSMYTVGLSTTDLMQLLLNPSKYMEEHPNDGTVTLTKDLWIKYQTGSSSLVISGITFEAAKDANSSIVPKSYDYVDAFFDTSNADELADAFRTITKEIILAEAQPPTDVPEGGDTTKSGYVIYTAPLGEYMKVKDVKCIIFQNQVFKEKSTSTSGNCTTYVFKGEVDSPVYDEESLSDIVIQVKQEDGTHQIVTIKIPASVMPLRSNTIRLNSHSLDEVVFHETEDDAPMRIVYSVGLMDEVDRETLAGVSPEYIEENTAEDGTVLFYCNAYDKPEISGDKTVGRVTAEFTAGDTNPFYYAPAGTVLYTGQNDMVATEFKEDTPYYIKQDYYYKNQNGASIYEPGWLGRSDLEKADTEVKTLEDGSQQLVLSRSILKEVNMANARNEKREGDNRSETADYAYYATERAGNPGEFLAYLGNNGRLWLENPLGELTISKTVQAAEGEELPENAEDTAFTLKLTAACNNGFPLTGTFFCEVYNSEHLNTASDTVTFDPSGTADLTIKSGQVIRLFLPKGTSITVSETPPNGYTVYYKDDNTAAADAKGENFAADTNAADIQVINTFTEAKIDILVKKVWNDNNEQDGKHPESITVKLLVNGSEGQTLTLSEENGWQGTFEGLNQNDDEGNEILYTIEEVEVDGYETSITWDDTTGFTITNTHTPESEPEPATGSLTVSKTVAGNDGDTSKAFHFTVTLRNTSLSGTYGDMTFENGVATFALKHGGNKTASGLPVGVTYTVVEQEADQDGYTTTATGAGGTITKDVTAEANFTNTKNSNPGPGPDPDSDIDIAVQKVWKLDDGGAAADSVTVTLYRDGKEYDTVNLNAQNGWRHTWYELSDRYSWTVEETVVPEGFTMTVNQQGHTFIIVNDDIPSKPDEPDVPDTPDKPDEPDIPDDPDIPDEPDVPDVPDTPDEPDIPDDPDTNIPDEPTPGDNVPRDPDTPDTPDEPDQPDEPGLPQTGQQWLLAGLLAVAGAALVVTGLWYKTRYRGKHEA